MNLENVAWRNATQDTENKELRTLVVFAPPMLKCNGYDRAIKCALCDSFMSYALTW